jgi:hypothetical protein
MFRYGVITFGFISISCSAPTPWPVSSCLSSFPFHFFQDTWPVRVRTIITTTTTTTTTSSSSPPRTTIFRIRLSGLFPSELVWNYGSHIDSRWDSLDGLSALSQGCHLHKITQTQDKRAQTSIPPVGFEHTIPVFEWAKPLHASDRAATVIDRIRSNVRKPTIPPFPWLQ